MDSEGCAPIFLICVILIATGWALCELYHATEPKPIDVYRGYTTLQITYQDSVPIDSVVVFKKEN